VKEKAGPRLRAIREGKGMSQTEFGAALDPEHPIIRATISAWEKGIHAVPYDIMKKAETLTPKEKGPHTGAGEADLFRSEMRVGRPAFSLKISRQQIDELLKGKSKARTWAYIGDVLSSHKDPISKAILKGLFLDMVSSSLTLQDAEALVDRYFQSLDLTPMESVHQALYYVWLHVIENMIDSYLQRQFEDTGYKKDLQLDLYVSISSTEITFRWVAKWDPFSDRVVYGTETGT